MLHTVLNFLFKQICYTYHEESFIPDLYHLCVLEEVGLLYQVTPMLTAHNMKFFSVDHNKNSVCASDIPNRCSRKSRYMNK